MNSVALITGASRGIGRSIALELAALGWDVVINYSANQPAARQTAADCASAAQEHEKKIRAEICQADIGSSPARRNLLEFTRTQFGRLDLLVNNAGVAPLVRADILEASEESFDRVLNINLKGPYFLTQLAANWMISLLQAGAFESGPAPKIVTISSISAFAASVNRGDYCIAKAGLAMVTPLFASRLAEHGIHVFEIRPGIIATDMTKPVQEKYDRLIRDGLSPIQRWGTGEDVAKAVAAIAQNMFPFSTGEVFNVDGGFHFRRL
jgi:NAD(P)-dependent dehydrogenase (short-subunit alcohol dehydrogenase family)